MIVKLIFDVVDSHNPSRLFEISPHNMIKANSYELGVYSTYHMYLHVHAISQLSSEIMYIWYVTDSWCFRLCDVDCNISLDICLEELIVFRKKLYEWRLFAFLTICDLEIYINVIITKRDWQKNYIFEFESSAQVYFSSLIFKSCPYCSVCVSISLFLYYILLRFIKL